MYESEFNLIMIYLITLEERKQTKEKDRHIHFQLASANID